MSNLARRNGVVAILRQQEPSLRKALQNVAALNKLHCLLSGISALNRVNAIGFLLWRSWSSEKQTEDLLMIDPPKLAHKCTSQVQVNK